MRTGIVSCTCMVCGRWQVLDSEVPPMQSQAALFEAGLQSGNFGGMLVELVAQVSPPSALTALQMVPCPLSWRSGTAVNVSRRRNN